MEATKIKVLGPLPMAASARVFVKADLGVSGALEEGLKNAGRGAVNMPDVIFVPWIHGQPFAAGWMLNTILLA